jgi:hypothetical protein
MSTSDPSEFPAFTFSPNVALAGISPYASSAYAPAGGAFDGVVRISTGTSYGSGTLLSTGRHILTAAHVVDNVAAGQLYVYFTLPTGVVRASVSRINIHPEWTHTDTVIDNDVAVLELSSFAPAAAQRYDIYTDQDEVGQTFTLVGFGAPTGDPNAAPATPERRTGINTFDSDATRFNQSMGWDVSPTKQLVFDFDNGNAVNDAFGRYFGLNGLGLGKSEAMLTPGDSGGPAFLQKNGELLVAGINSYTSRPGGNVADVDSVLNGSVGEFASEMRVSAYKAWIDAQTGVERVIVGQAGTRPDRTTVSKTVKEGGVTWFLVEIGEAQTKEVSVHYATRDGSAKAGEDYLSAHGDIVFAPGQTWCRVMIETLADSKVEGNEAFSLALTMPQGGCFPDARTELVASRTILDDAQVTLVGIAPAADAGVIA